MDIQQLITLLRNGIFQRNLVIALAIYWKVHVQNSILICSVLTLLLYDVLGVNFFPDTV